MKHSMNPVSHVGGGVLLWIWISFAPREGHSLFCRTDQRLVSVPWPSPRLLIDGLMESFSLDFSTKTRKSRSESDYPGIEGRAGS